MSDNKDNKDIKNHKTFKLLILLLLFIGIIFIKEDNQNTLISFLNSFKNTESQIELVNSINIPETLSMKMYKDNLAIWSENKLTLFDAKGNLQMKKQFNFQSPLIHFGNEFIYVGDKSTGTIYKIDSIGETKNRINFENSFFNIKEENENIVLHTKSTDKESVYIYDKNDVLIGNHSFKDKNIINYALGSSEEYSLSILILNGDSLKSNIVFYGKNNKELYSLDMDSEIILHSQFVKKQTMIALTDQSLYFIKDGKIVWQRSFNLIKDIYIKDKIYILHSNYLESIDYEGKTIEKIGFNKDCQKILPFNRDILVYGENSFSVISDGKEILSNDVNIDILSSSKDKIFILKNDKLDIYKVSKK